MRGPFITGTVLPPKYLEPNTVQIEKILAF